RRCPMVSSSESPPASTSDNATAPLNAFATLAMRMWSFFRGRPGSPTVAPPAVCTPRTGPRCTIAVALGGPPGIATSSRSARSSAAAAALADAAVAARGRSAGTMIATTTRILIDRLTIRRPSRRRTAVSRTPCELAGHRTERRSALAAHDLGGRDALPVRDVAARTVTGDHAEVLQVAVL